MVIMIKRQDNKSITIIMEEDKFKIIEIILQEGITILETIKVMINIIKDIVMNQIAHCNIIKNIKAMVLDLLSTNQNTTEDPIILQ